MPSQSLTKFIETLHVTDRDIVKRDRFSDNWDRGSVQRLGDLIPTFKAAGFDTVYMELDFDELSKEHCK